MNWEGSVAENANEARDLLASLCRRARGKWEEHVDLSVEDADKIVEILGEVEGLRDHLEESVWQVCEAYGGDRGCEDCRGSVHKIDKRRGSYSCMAHGVMPRVFVERRKISKWIKGTCGVWAESTRQLLEDLADQIVNGDHEKYHKLVGETGE